MMGDPAKEHQTQTLVEEVVPREVEGFPYLQGRRWRKEEKEDERDVIV